MNYRSKINDLLIEYKIASDSIETERRSLIETNDQLTNSEDAQKVIQIVASSVQELAHNKIADVVSKCLESIFDEPYKFKIKFERKRGKTEAKLLFERNGLEVDPLTASGGGVIDIASFALRLACLVLTRPPIRRLMVSDEPFRFISSEYRSRVKALLETLSEEMGIQFIQVTHIDALKCGKVIEIK